MTTLGLRIGRMHSARVVMFHQAVADRLGLNTTDLKCLDLAASTATSLTAGQLAELTGLSTGAITGVIDRLEAAGFVRRQRDPKDRRRVIIESVPGREHEVAALFRSLAQGIAQLCARYSDAELALLVEFVGAANDLLHQETARMRQ